MDVTTARHATSAAINRCGGLLVSSWTIHKSHIVTRKKGPPFSKDCAPLTSCGLNLGGFSRKRKWWPLHLKNGKQFVLFRKEGFKTQLLSQVSVPETHNSRYGIKQCGNSVPAQTRQKLDVPTTRTVTPSTWRHRIWELRVSLESTAPDSIYILWIGKNGCQGAEVHQLCKCCRNVFVGKERDKVTFLGNKTCVSASMRLLGHRLGAKVQVTIKCELR